MQKRDEIDDKVDEKLKAQGGLELPKKTKNKRSKT